MFSLVNRKAKQWVIKQIKRRPVVLISDTTLRDGAQMPGIHFDVEARITVARALADAGVHSIDIGFPAAGVKELQTIQSITKQVKGPVLSVLARTKDSDIAAAGEALSGYPIHKRVVTLFLGTSKLHREHKHQLSKSEIIKTATDAVLHAQECFQLISFAAEDASRTEPEFLHLVYEEVIQAGATSIGYADTVGVLTPAGAKRAVAQIGECVPSIDSALLAVHFHNDLGLATANALAAVEAGADIVQGTINGIGERAGNVAIEEVVLALTLHKDEYKKTVDMKPQSLFELSRLVSQAAQWWPADNKPVVGRNMFRTEAGIHQDGLLKNRETYLPFPPELIGAGPVELVLGPTSGSSAVRHHLQRNGVQPTEDLVRRLLNHIKGDVLLSEEDEEVSETMAILRDHLSLGGANGKRPQPPSS